jgi:hypothetical protein
VSYLFNVSERLGHEEKGALAGDCRAQNEQKVEHVGEDFKHTLGVHVEARSLAVAIGWRLQLTGVHSVDHFLCVLPRSLDF